MMADTPRQLTELEKVSEAYQQALASEMQRDKQHQQKVHEIMTGRAAENNVVNALNSVYLGTASATVEIVKDALSAIELGRLRSELADAQERDALGRFK